LSSTMMESSDELVPTEEHGRRSVTYKKFDKFFTFGDLLAAYLK
jgi:hypothetical protein